MSKRILNPKDPNLDAYESWLEDEILGEYRVYADGTVQDAEEEPYPFMSDDFVIVRALDEERAYEIWQLKEENAWITEQLTEGAL